jgi:pilus assembly protein CpaE
MLRGAIICPDQQLLAELKDALAETHRVGIVRIVDRYVEGVELVRFLRAAAPEVVFLSVESRRKALDLASAIESQAPGTQVVAVDREVNSSTLVETMRAGIREFLSSPFEAEVVQQTLQRTEQILERRPPSIESTDLLLAFIPAKAGVGCSTIALNTSIALSQLPDTKTLLSDFDLNCGIVDFMLQTESKHSIATAAENAHQMDETLWDKLVTTRGDLDFIPAGRTAPGFRIDAMQIRYLLEFARRNYKVICTDLSGILEKFSIEILHEAKQIFLVCTPEVPSLHLAREKLRFFRTMDLDGRVKILLNRSQKRSLIPFSEIEKLLGRPIFMSFPNDYVGVHKALTAGKQVSPASELGKGFLALAKAIRNPQEPAKAGFFELLRSSKKPEPASPEPGLVAS